jgi:hypothetical protein
VVGSSRVVRQNVDLACDGQRIFCYGRGICRGLACVWVCADMCREHVNVNHVCGDLGLPNAECSIIRHSLAVVPHPDLPTIAETVLIT